jgi:tetratricopeptide (TPR) repeat protein
VLYASQGQYDKARTALEVSIRTHPSYATAHENLGDVYAKMATQAYDKALQLDKSNKAAQAKLEKIKELFSTSARTTGKPAASKTTSTILATAAAAVVPQPNAPAPAEDEVLKSVNHWAKAWSDNDLAAYFASYAPDFQTPGGEPRADWEAARKARIAKPKKIDVRVVSPKVKFTDSNRAAVTFKQSYRSSNVKVASTKTLVLVKAGDRWLIQQERVGS